MHLARHPRLRFAHLPTPLEPMLRLSQLLGGPRLWIKRDDCTGLSLGGNKTRKLEFLMADALERKADTIITQGATQSNHARQTAAIAAKLGLTCHILLENRTGYDDEPYTCNGNVLLDRLHAATVSQRPAVSNMAAEMDKVAAALRDDGKRPYVIPGGGSNAVGALGYVNAALELLSQANECGLVIDHVVHATGSAGTQAGLVTGLVALRAAIPVLGISVRASRDEQEAAVLKLARDTAEHLGLGDIVCDQHVIANCDYVGDGYGIPTESAIEAISLVARTEGILLDPVYSGKAMAGLIDLIRKGHFREESSIVFLHTGGTAALFAYPRILSQLPS